MTSPPCLDWIFWSTGPAELDAGSERLMLIGSSILVPGVALEVAYLIWKVSCLDAVAACLKGVVDELELSVEMVPLTLEAVVLVIDLMIAFDLCKRVLALLVHHCFVKCVKGGGQACEEIVEPGGIGSAASEV
jgi:hypothetical protein